MGGKRRPRNMRMVNLTKMVAIWLMVSLVLLTGQAVAQEGTYRLQPQDVIRIQVYNEPSINSVLPIGRDGNVSAPFVGTVRAAGKTTAELEQELAQLYQARLNIRDPRVSVTIEVFRPIRASVGGMVTQPGLYDFRPGDTLITLVNRGGGAHPDRADMRRATLRRQGSQEVIPVDLYSMLVKGDMSQDYELQDGDVLTVPEETRNRVLVLGAIQAPGAYPYKEPMTLADAITLARGPIPIRSKLSETYIIREQPGRPGSYIRIRSNYVNYIRKGDDAQNVVLMPGDLVYVSETKTPDPNFIGSTLNTFFILDRFLRDGLFGFRLFR
jgi:protein involved in polysaccharide export with SLBB domain